MAELAVNVGAVATPLALVPTLGDALNVPDAPLAGAANVTNTSVTPLPNASVTVAFSAVANAVLICALCGVPAVAVMLAGGPGLFVRLKFAEMGTPPMFVVAVAR